MLTTSVRSIEKQLMRVHYAEGASSIAASSHWQLYSRTQQVQEQGGELRLSGQGFGDCMEASLKNRLRLLPLLPYLRRMQASIEPRIRGELKAVLRRSGRIVTYDTLRMALTLQHVRANVREDLSNKRFAVIGDGFGVLGSLIKEHFPQAQVVFVNLGRTLLFDLHFCARAFPRSEHKLIAGRDEWSRDFSYVEAERVQVTGIEADFFFNIVSFQEMNPEVVTSYFDDMRNSGRPYLYCCNRTEKELPDGTFVRFDDYGWRAGDEVLVDELCPWHQTFPASRPPFTRRFDGPIRHRLARLAPR